jgi:hypothetical protein
MQAHNRNFLRLSGEQQVDLLTSAAIADANSPLRKLFDIARNEVIRGYYTSAAGLQELDYKGNAYYTESPGCESKS